MNPIAMPCRIHRLLGFCAALLGATNAVAAPMTFMDRAAFDAAVAAIGGVSADVLNFDSTAAGTIFQTTDSHQGVTFNYNLLGYELGVDNANPGTSGANTLKVSDDGGFSFANFALGDSINFTFGPSHAFGMYIIVGTTAFDFFDNDINLSFAGTTLSNVDSDAASLVGPNNVAALFVGIVDSAATFTSADLQFGAPGGSGAFFEIDDIVKTSATTTGPGPSPMPEPATLALLGLGMLGLGVARRGSAV